MEWISVKDRLPENQRDVLVHFSNGCKDVSFCSDWDKSWAKHDGFPIPEDWPVQVTHWMELPPSPKGSTKPIVI